MPLQELLPSLAAGLLGPFADERIIEILLDQAEKLCHRVGIIDQGQVIATGTLDELRQQAAHGEAYSLEDIFLQLTGGSEERERTRGPVKRLSSLLL